MKPYFPAFVALLLFGGCCKKTMCTGVATLDLVGFSKDDLEKGICKAEENGWKGDRPIYGKTHLVIPVTESPMYLYFPSDTLEITVHFQKERCSVCTYGFMDPVYREVSGFEFRGKKSEGNTLTINR